MAPIRKLTTLTMTRADGPAARAYSRSDQRRVSALVATMARRPPLAVPASNWLTALEFGEYADRYFLPPSQLNGWKPRRSSFCGSESWSGSRVQQFAGGIR